VHADAPLVRTAALPWLGTRWAARWAVGGLVAVAALVHTALAWRRATPGYFPDEYMYAELGRSLLETGSPLVRGESSGFVSLLYPVLTAPAWLWDDVEAAYRTIQALNGLAMALAAVPAFLLARRLGAGAPLALGAAALAVATPELVYSGAVMAEALAYPLALAVAWAAVRAVQAPSAGAQGLVLALSALAAATRVQLAVLPLCYLLGVAVAGRLREHRLAAGTIGLGLAAGLALALTGSVGIYGDVTAYRVEPGDALSGLGATALVLAYASGWVLVPGAVLGAWGALTRSREPGERAFAAFALGATALLLAQAAVVGDAGRAQERYALYALPLVLLLFCVYAAGGEARPRAHALLAAAGAAVAALVPLAGWAAGGGSSQSLVLAAVRRLEGAAGDVGLASLLVALAATALSAVVVAVSFARPRRLAAVALVLAGGAALATAAAAASFYGESRAALRAALLPADPSWVDAAANGPVTLLAAPRSTGPDLHSTLFWNRAVDHLALLDEADRPDAFAALAAEPDGAGRIDLPTTLVLTDGHGSTVLLRGAERLEAGPTKTLWRTDGTARLELLVAGRYHSGVLAADGGLRAWPERPGGRLAAWLELELSAPAATALAVELPSGRELAWRVRPGATTSVRVPVCAAGVWTASFRTEGIALAHGTRVGPRSTEPRLFPDARACP
jgi:hypothetical protein